MSILTNEMKSTFKHCHFRLRLLLFFNQLRTPKMKRSMFDPSFQSFLVPWEIRNNISDASVIDRTNVEITLCSIDKATRTLNLSSEKQTML